ncbi:A disintegrin and metalloproteinase with thrombospondin motifs like isoform X2 [Prorops nasuta]|uniref:A disintegrin and metalloproteinase with thrombospondin motifs like isoform X2 n=1 Tax=Prorops nasuta TaxID=863751 RepID=UPI0034CE9274
MFKYISPLFFFAPFLILCNVKLTKSYIAAENTPVYIATSNASSPSGVEYNKLFNPFRSILEEFSHIDNQPLYSMNVAKYTERTVPLSSRQPRSAFYSGGNQAMYTPPMAQDIIHPKVLVTIDYPLLKKIGPQTEKVLKYVLSFFLGVNMRYRMLTNPKIRFNIAGIILSWDQHAVPYIANNLIRNDLINTFDALNKMADYFRNEKRLNKDSYDLVVILTNSSLGSQWNDQVNEGFMNGLSYITTGCAEADHDGQESENTENCSTNNVMAPSRPLGVTEFQWSSCSINALRKFLNNDTAQCVHSPLPNLGRVVNIPLPGQLLNANDQCEAGFGYGVKACQEIQHQNCSRLKCCRKPDLKEMDSFSAAEGTPCNDDKHFCLDGYCVSKP